MMQTIGQRLKAAREERQVTLEKAFQATRIRVAYLQALEADDHTVMPSPAQARGYLRNYAEYLGLNFEQLLDEMRLSQESNGAIITPADLTERPLVQAPTLDSPQDATPPAPPVDAAQEGGPRPEPVQPKRRGRKKIEPLDAVQDKPEPTALVEAQAAEIEEPRQHLEPVAGAVVEPPQEEPAQSAATDNLWQAWLNRVSSIISVRAGTRKGTQETTDTLPSGDFQKQEEMPAPQPAQPGNLQPSEEIFREIGHELRSRRETLSLHLEEVERNTHVKAHYLEALELGAMDRLPSTVQTRGMLSNYASFLDMDVDALLLRFADALQARHREKNPQRPARQAGQPILASLPPRRNFIAGDMIFGIGMAVLLVGFVIWGINRVLTLQSLEEIQPTAPSISDVLLASPASSLFTPTATFLPVESFPTEATVNIIIPTVNVNINVQVNLVVIERTFLRAVVDDVVAFDGRVVPGNAYLFEAERRIEILVGNGAAIRIVHNGRDLGLLGGFGQVVNNIYLAEEVITPTALPSPTPTRTLRPSPTPRPSITPVPSRTPSP